MKLLRIPIAILICMSVFLAHYRSTVQTSSDSRWFVPTAMSIIEEKNINIDEYAFFIEQSNYYGVEEVDGHLYNWYPIGTAIIAVPFVWVFDWYFDRALGLDLRAALKHNPTEGMEKYVASILVAVTAALIFLTAETLCRNIPVSLLAVCIFSFCTPAWSTASRALWQNTPSMLMLTIALYCFIRARREPRWILLSAVPLAFAFTVRPTNIVALASFSLLVLVEHRKYLIQFLLLASIVLVPFVLLNLSIYGSVLPPYYSANRIGFGAHVFEGLAGNLISPNRGIFAWSPVLLFSVQGAVLKFRRKQYDRLDVTLACIILMHWLVISSTSVWWGGGSIGPRFFSDVVPFFMYFLIPAMIDIPAPRVSRYAYVGVFSIFTLFSFFTHYRGANSVGVIQWNAYPEHIDRNPARAWDWRDLQFLRKSGVGNQRLAADLIVATVWSPYYNVKHLLDLGADLEATTPDGWTPLMLAASDGNEHTVRVLLERGANVNAKGRFGVTPLMAAAWHGHSDITIALIAHGADIDARKNDGITALMLAAWNGHAEIAGNLLKAGANANAKTEDGATALLVAATSGNRETIRILVESGAEINARDAYGCTPLMAAAERGENEIANMIIDMGASVNAQDLDGETALMYAARQGHKEVVLCLLANGAEADIQNVKGQTALSVSSRYPGITKLLDEASTSE